MFKQASYALRIDGLIILRPISHYAGRKGVYGHERAKANVNDAPVATRHTNRVNSAR